MAEDGLVSRWRRVLRSRERLAIVLYLVLVLAPLVLGASASLRHRTLDRFEGLARYWDDRWSRRVERAETLVAAGRYEQVLPYLEELDRTFPAPTAKYARDRERERVLEALAASHAALGRNRRALETYQRLAAFDPLNFRNHYLLASHALATGDEEIALASFERVFAIHPGHEASVDKLVAYHFGRGDFAAVTRTYEAYLDAFEIGRVELVAANASDDLRIPVDGRPHDALGLLALEPGASGTLRVRSGPHATEVLAIGLASPRRVGVAAPTDRWVGDAEGWRRPGGTPVAPGGVWRVESGGELAVELPPLSQGLDRVSLRLRLYKPVGPALWRAVERSYRNLVDLEGLRRARARTFQQEPPA